MKNDLKLPIANELGGCRQQKIFWSVLSIVLGNSNDIFYRILLIKILVTKRIVHNNHNKPNNSY